MDELAEKSGINLGHIERVLYETPSGQVAGIATASPLEGSPDRWWLGLPGDEFDIAILLCEHQDGHILPVILGADFLDEYSSLLSRDGRNQVKFVITRAGSAYCVQVPGVGRIDAKPYCHDYDSLT